MGVWYCEGEMCDSEDRYDLLESCTPIVEFKRVLVSAIFNSFHNTESVLKFMSLKKHSFFFLNAVIRFEKIKTVGLPGYDSRCPPFHVKRSKMQQTCQAADVI